MVYLWKLLQANGLRSEPSADKIRMQLMVIMNTLWECLRQYYKWNIGKQNNALSTLIWLPITRSDIMTYWPIEYYDND